VFAAMKMILLIGCAPRETEQTVFSHNNLG